MSTPTTFRHDLRVALFGLLTAFQAANPTLLRQVYRARPASFHPPLAYIGPIAEPNVVHDSGTRERNYTAQLVLVQGLWENAETGDRQDVLADLFTDYLTANFHVISGTSSMEEASSEDVELDVGGGTVYAATVFTVRGNILEGRV